MYINFFFDGSFGLFSRELSLFLGNAFEFIHNYRSLCMILLHSFTSGSAIHEMKLFMDHVEIYLSCTSE